jgi:hypothetical protein
VIDEPELWTWTVDSQGWMVIKEQTICRACPELLLRGEAQRWNSSSYQTISVNPLK